MTATSAPASGADTGAAANACTACGACCAHFRVDFAVYEMADMGGTVPPHLAMDVKGNACRMRGTDTPPMRCVALHGVVGEAVACSIYALRPSPCRDFPQASPGCDKARSRHGLAPLNLASA